MARFMRGAGSTRTGRVMALAAACVTAGVGALLGAAPAQAGDTVWLCRPGLANNPCVGNLTTTMISMEGQAKVERARSARRPKVDCFYVYPTVSGQQTVNATLAIDPEERAVARFQASRFSQTCRVFAPMYRQVTLLGIQDRSNFVGRPGRIAYGDVRSAWRDYLANHNRGRGVVLLGHSQGTYHLRRLISDEIDRRPRVRSRLVSALLLGGNVTVRRGRTTGGDFKNIPACRSSSQTGCVIAFSIFGSTPPDDALFGVVSAAEARRGLEAMCTNPAALRGGSGRLTSYVSTAPFPGALGAGIDLMIGGRPTATTPWVGYRNGYEARCARHGRSNALLVRPRGTAPELRPVPNAQWGLHLGDVNIPLGQLTSIVADQARTYLRRH
jgi:hypothetical protein